MTESDESICAAFEQYRNGKRFGKFGRLEFVSPENEVFALCSDGLGMFMVNFTDKGRERKKEGIKI